MQLHLLVASSEQTLRIYGDEVSDNLAQTDAFVDIKNIGRAPTVGRYKTSQL